MASQVDIANLALTTLGADRIIDFTDDTEVARKVNAIYDLLRKEVLRAHPWNFAIKRVQLAQLATTPVYEYTYEYQLPSDSLRIIRITDGEDRITDYKIEGKKLLTDDGTVYVRYLWDITDAEQFDSAFVSAFATRLAAELAHAISNNTSLAQLQYELYERKIRLAKAQDAQESPDSFKENEDFWSIDSRV